MPYTIMNLGTQQRDVRVEVWMTSDGVLDGSGSDIQLTNGEGPLFHLYTMSPLGFNLNNNFPGNAPTVVDGNIWFFLPALLYCHQVPAG